MSDDNPKNLLLSSQLSPQDVAALLTPYGFQDIKKADANLQAMADEPRARQLLAEIIEPLLTCISDCPDPDQALNYLERFTRATFSKVQLFTYLKASPHTLDILARLFGSSPFLSEILIRNPTYLYWIADPKTLDQEKQKAELVREVSATLQTLKTDEKRLEALCLFKRKELLRIGARDLLKKATVEETMSDLSALAETLIQKVYEICDQSLRRRYGAPLLRAAGRLDRTAAFTVLGMGKLGGGELNFSSDVDLLYLYESAAGKTSGAKSRDKGTQISNAEYFKRLSQSITTALTELTHEGYLYRVDLRLRPEGRTGEICHPLEGYLKYYASRGETWERLALLKAWPVAGNISLGQKFIKKVSPFIYRPSFSIKALQEIRHVKDRIDRKMDAKGESVLNVKLGTGGIREIEFIVQSLQISFGGLIPRIRERNTLKALDKLSKQKLLAPEVYADLRKAYIFLRNVEHSLQMVHEFQTHRLPDSSRELRICALRLGYRDRDQATATDQFLTDLRLHTRRVNQLFRDLFYTPEASMILKTALKKGHPPR